MLQTFTVVAVSTNTNSFGLKSIMCLAPSGEGLQLLQSANGGSPVPVRGDQLELDPLSLPRGIYECPRKLDNVEPALAAGILAEVAASINPKLTDVA